jgi:hypothetical protein
MSLFFIRCPHAERSPSYFRPRPAGSRPAWEKKGTHTIFGKVRVLFNRALTVAGDKHTLREPECGYKPVFTTETGPLRPENHGF